MNTLTLRQKRERYGYYDQEKCTILWKPYTGKTPPQPSFSMPSDMSSSNAHTRILMVTHISCLVDNAVTQRTSGNLSIRKSCASPNLSAEALNIPSTVVTSPRCLGGISNSTSTRVTVAKSDLMTCLPQWGSIKETLKYSHTSCFSFLPPPNIFATSNRHVQESTGSCICHGRHMWRRQPWP